MADNKSSTRVRAPDNRLGSRVIPGIPLPGLMKPSPQTHPLVEGGGLILTRAPGGKRLAATLDLRTAIRIATWNVLTLAPLGYPEVIVKEMTRYNISIAGFTEARMTDRGKQTLDGCTLIHSGGKSKLLGVALFLDKSSSKALISWDAVSDRLLTARLKHRLGALTIIVAYAPTEISPLADKDVFYSQLEALVTRIPTHDKVVILGDMNASTGACRSGFENVIGRFGYGEENDNSSRMLSMCASHGLSVMGSWFQRKNIHRLSWISNDGRTRKELDHILASDRSMFISYRVFRGAEAPALTDHRLVCAEITLRLHKPPRNVTTPKLDVSSLSLDPRASATFQLEIRNRFAPLATLPPNVNDSWNLIKSGILSAATSSIKPLRVKHRPWLSNDTLAIVDLKRKAHQEGNLSEWRRLKGIFKARAKADLESWYSDIATEVEAGISKNESKAAYRALRKLRSSHSRMKCTVAISKLDGSPCVSDSETSERWKQHFESALNFPAAVPCQDLDDAAASAPECSFLNVLSPSYTEVLMAINNLKNGRAPGADGIFPEFLKYAGPPVVEALHCLFENVWLSGHIPSEWRDGIIIPVYKGKGSRSQCGNYRPISLLSIPGKVFSQILLQRIQPLLLAKRRPQQSGFTSGRSAMDAVLALRLLASVHREFNQPLNVAYVDIKAAFDSVDRSALWKILKIIGVPSQLSSLIIGLHENTMASVRTSSGVSPPFPTTSGVRQGCVLAPSLFCTAIDQIMTSCEGSYGITVDSNSFGDLDYADDAALMASDPSRWHSILSHFRDAAASVGLCPSWSKTKVQNLAAGPSPLSVSIDGQSVEAVDSFIYLGSEVNSSGYCLSDVRRRIGIASSVMSQLDRTWKQARLSLATKLRIYQSCVMSTLLYGSECWCLLKKESDLLQSFHMRCQRRLLNVHWWDRITNAEISRRTGLPSILLHIESKRHSLFGHVRRLSPESPAHKALLQAISIQEGSLPPSWRRPRGRPRTNWLKQCLLDFSLTPREAWTLAADRVQWKSRRPSAGYASQ